MEDLLDDYINFQFVYILVLIQIFSMMNPQASRHGLTSQEIDLIQKELSAAGVSGDLNQSQLEALTNLLGNERTSSDLALYLRQRIIDKPPQLNQPQNIASQNKPSMFKQFAEIKIEAGQPHKEYVCKSKRKVKPTESLMRNTLQQAVQEWDANTTECHSMFEKRGRKGFSGVSVGALNESCLWNFNQQFYSCLDRNYLKQQPLRRLLNEMELNPERMTYYEHRMIRQALPAPKLFDPQFITAEISKLYEVISQSRMIPRHKGRDSDLSVGKEVIAIHPVCGHLHTGSILAIYKENQFMVKFQRPELGTQKVLDTLMTPREISSHQRVVIENIDFQVMGLAIRLLQYKADLVKLLKEYNVKAQLIQKSQGTLDNVFFQEYGWIGSTINILSLGLKHVISKFRVRGLNKQNQEKVGRHFASILINPLNLMEKELDKSSENSDHYASRQIKNIISTHKQSRTEQLAKEFFSKVSSKLQQSDMQQLQKTTMEKLLKSMIGLLVNLRYQSRSFSLEDNKYLTQLMNVIDASYPEHYNEIYETLHSITSKLGEELK